MFLSDELQGSASSSGTVPETGSIIPVTEKLESGNEASMVLVVQYGQFDMLLTGDVEGEGEKQLTQQLEESYPDCTWEVLKAAHHGSKNSSTIRSSSTDSASLCVHFRRTRESVCASASGNDRETCRRWL